jgi:cation:H+ antiporter
MLFDILIILICIVGLAAGASWVVDSSVSIANWFRIPELVIGLTNVAFGTSAPELATSIVAAIRGHHGISIGNLIGSDIFNMYGVLGLTAIMQNITVDTGVRANMLVLIAMILLVLLFIRTKWTLSRWEGGVLILLGLVRWGYSFAVS